MTDHQDNRGWGSLAQPPPVPPPASHPSPTDPVLRANPCPEVTDPICRLPLPTLFYRLEAVHLGDLLRISVRPGTRITPSPQDFQGLTAVHRTPQEARCFTGPTSLSPGEPIPGSSYPYKEKRTLPGTTVSVSWFVCVAALGLPGGRPISVSGYGNIDPIPFRPLWADKQCPAFRTALAYVLGPTDPCSTAVHMEPFPTSVFKVLA